MRRIFSVGFSIYEFKRVQAAIKMAAAVCAAAVADEREAEKSAAGEFRESGFGQGIVKGNDRIQLRGQRLQ